MGQAKRKGSFEERQKLALMLVAEEEAWKEYYEREAKDLDTWFFRRLDPDAQAFIRRAENHRNMTRMLYGLFNPYMGRNRHFLEL